MKILALDAYTDTTAVTTHSRHVPAAHFSEKQIDILRNSICKGVSAEEFEIFLMACTKTQLDPFMRQIYAVKRGSTMTIQTGIDGYRLIAERTGLYAPGPEPTYTYDDQNRVLSATAYVKKQTRDGTWHVVSSSAYVEEYMQRTREGRPMGMWATMPRTMLAKCAESQALRKAFPAEMSGVYTADEMQQSDTHVQAAQPAHVQAAQQEPVETLNQSQIAELEMILGDCSTEFVNEIYDRLFLAFKTKTLSLLPATVYTRLKKESLKNMEYTIDKQKQEFSEIQKTEEV